MNDNEKLAEEHAALYEALNCLWVSGRQVMHDLPASGWKCGFEASMDLALKTLNRTRPPQVKQP